MLYIIYSICCKSYKRVLLDLSFVCRKGCFLALREAFCGPFVCKIARIIVPLQYERV